MMDEPDCVAGGNSSTLNTLLTSIEAEIAKVHANFPAREDHVYGRLRFLDLQ